jgi:N-acyl homoserine lactone hydrolase
MANENRVRIIPCGGMSTDLTWLLLAPGRAMRRRQDKDLPAEWVLSPSHCVLVETPAGRLLWDTSCPRDWEERWAPAGLQDFFPYDQVSEDEYLDSRMQQLAITPDDVDFVVVSHMHMDHVGNASMFDNGHTRFFCSKAEKDYAFSFDEDFLGSHLKAADYGHLNWETVDGDQQDFLPGVSFIQTPGHTPGSMSMRVDLADTGTMIFTADAVYMGENYGPPVVPASVVNDLGDWYASVEKLRRIGEETDATMIFGHDSHQMQTLRLAPEGVYS